jgi:uncharacterized protein Yka (UPF0111/DUF47 family)
MAFNIKPKEEKFFEYFVEASELIKDSADLLCEAMDGQKEVEDCMQKIEVLERKVDDVTDTAIGKLNKTFITPLDREDIYAIAQKLDDVADNIQNTVVKMYLYNASPASEGAKELAKVLLKATKQMEKAFSQLSTIKKHRLKLQARCSRIVVLEDKGDRLYREEVAKLFRECKDPIELIKWKEILSELEKTLDICEDVANLLKGVVLKYA